MAWVGLAQPSLVNVLKCETTGEDGYHDHVQTFQENAKITMTLGLEHGFFNLHNLRIPSWVLRTFWYVWGSCPGTWVSSAQNCALVLLKSHLKTPLY